MLIHTGTYGSSTTESNSFVANLLKYPEIRSTIVDLYPQYSLSYFLEHTGRYAKKVEVGDRIVKWPVQGRKSRPSVIDPAFTGSATAGLGNTSFNVTFDPNQMYLNPYDTVRFPDNNGTIAWVYAINGNVVTFKLQTNSLTLSVDLSAVGGMTLGVTGNMFPEGSERGYGNQAFPDWYMNALGTFRRQLDITGDALTDVLWIEVGGQKLWFWKQEYEWMQEILYIREVDRWTSHITVDANGNPMQFDAQNRPIFKGDGLLTQVFPGNADTWNGILAEQRVTEFIGLLNYNVGIKSPTYLVYTGTGGLLAWDRAMKNFFITPGALMWDANTGGETQLGSHFNTYHTLGAKIVVTYNPIFDDPNIMGNDMVTTPYGTYPRASFDMFFANVGLYGAQSNLELAVKSAGGVNRGSILKYLPGMVDPYKPNSMYAMSAEDKFSVEFLCQDALVLHNPHSCGMLRYV